MKILIPSLIILGLAIWASDSRAFELTGTKWTKVYEWNIGQGCPDFVEQLAPAIFNKLSPVETRQVEEFHGGTNFDGHSTIWCSEYIPRPSSEVSLENLPEGTERIDYGEAGIISGKASWWHDNGETVECDIWLTDQITLFSFYLILPHEIGHCLGLAHSENPDTVMHEIVNYADDWHIDDLGGLSVLYNKCAAIIDGNGTTYFPRIDPLLWLDATGLFPEYQGQFVSGFLDENARFPQDIYDIQVSQCD